MEQRRLAQAGCIDFDDSIVIHMVGGISAFVGAWLLGPRIGKYAKDSTPRAIPGHAITLGALGCFVLWFAWYGFNGAWGGIAVGLFGRTNGLFYGSGFHQLGIQIIGVVAIAVHTFVVMFVVF